MNDQKAVMFANDAVQAQERLHLHVKNNKDKYSVHAFEHSLRALEHLRSLKSEIEGTHVKFQQVAVNKTVLQDKVRPLMLMNIPGSLNENEKQSLKGFIEEAFQGTCKKLIFAGIVTCPWYWCTNDDRGIQAKHNKIFVVYQYHNDQVFTPVNPHTNEQNQVIDEDWFYASEIEHFTHYLHKGSSRFIECLFLPEDSLIYYSEEWVRLKAEEDLFQIVHVRGFLEQCRGQAVGSVAKKSKSGHMYLRDGATLYNFCESYRLLHHAHSVLCGGSLNMDRVQEQSLISEYAKQAYEKLILAYQVDCKSVHKDDLFVTLMKWKGEVDKLMKTHKFTKPPIIESVLAKWMYTVRIGKQQLASLEVVPSTTSTLESLMNRISGDVSGMPAEQILMVAQAGSFLYDLATPTSDVDFVVIYADSVQKVLGSCVKPVESFEKRGPKLDFEYGAYEARLFAEMLWKGSVVILELVFSDGLAYTSKSWQMLAENRQIFVTERAILQYFGLIKNNMVMIENQKHMNTPRERKLFYQIFHKLNSLEYFLQGTVPQVKCSGSVKDFIMSIRHGPLEGDISRDKLYSLATEKINNLKTAFSNRTKRLPENVDYDFLKNWLKFVRGWQSS